MRWLAALIAIAVFLLVVLLYATSSAHDAEPVAPLAPLQFARSTSDAAAIEPDTKSAASPGLVETTQPTPGSTRATNPKARSRAAIQGRVRRADGTPAARVLVGLFAPAERDDGPSSPFAAVFQGFSTLRQTLRTVQTWTGTDEQGLFEFDDPDPGTWIVRAEDGPLLAIATDPFVLDLEKTVQGLELQLPIEAWLEGRLILPTDADLSGLCLELRANAEFSIARWMPVPNSLVHAVRTRIGPDAMYRLGPLETGLATVGLVIDTGIESRGRPDPVGGAVVPLVDVYMPAGVTHRDIDVRDGLPGSIRLSFELRRSKRGENGLVVPDDWSTEMIRVRAQQIAGSQDIESFLQMQRSGDVTELDLGPLAPGMWRITANLGTAIDAWVVADQVQVVPGARTDVIGRLTLIRARVNLVEAKTGEAIAGDIQVGRIDDEGKAQAVTILVQEGWIDLSLPPGEYMVTTREEDWMAWMDDPRAWAKLVWDENGPTLSTLRVPR